MTITLAGPVSAFFEAERAQDAGGRIASLEIR